MSHESLTPNQKKILENIYVRQIVPNEGAKWVELIRQHHYLGLHHLVGQSLCYVAEFEGMWLALLSWSAPALECRARDQWIGWEPVLKWQRISYITNNSRFLILPGIRVPNLASRVLALNLKRLAQDWKRAHGHKVLLAETFVDPAHFTGSCYKGGGWLELGRTSGWGRSGRKYYRHDRQKMVFVRSIHQNARRLLADPWPHPVYAEVKPMKLSLKHADGLMDVLRGLPDPRKRRGIRHRYWSILAMATCAVLSGAQSYIAIAQWAQNCTQNMLNRLGCSKNRKTGRFTAPSEPTLRRTLQETDAENVDRALGGWLALLHKEEKSGISIDGKTLRGARQSDDRAVHLLSAFLHRQGVVVAQKQVDAKSNEITAAIPLLDPLDIEGMVVTADAMHTQKKFVTFLVEDKKADFLGMVKDNQPTLHEDIIDLDMPGSFPPSG